MSPETHEPEQLAEGTLISHLLELRDRLLRSMIAVLVVFLPFAFFSNELFTIIASPLIDKLPEGNSLIATSVVAPFMTPLKLALFAAIFVAMPYVLYQAWAFIAPGLYRHEKRFALPMFASSVVLFYAGTAFAYFVVFPLMFRFLAMTTPAGVICLIVLLLESTTYTVPAALMATPRGELNRALLPVPSVLPLVLASPANVVTTPPGAIFRIV